MNLDTPYLPATVSIAPRFGAVRLESDPAGARVLDEYGRKFGLTPLTVQQLKPGIWKFTLEQDSSETAVVSLVVSQNQTNQFQTNLVNRYYAAALREAQSYFKAGRYEAAAVSADEALKYKPDDDLATALRREAIGMSHLALARMNGERENLAAELNQAVKFIPDNAEAKQLLADYTKREADRIEAERKREAERIAAERKRAAELAEKERLRQEAELAERKAQAQIRQLHASFNVLVSGFENADQFQEHELAASGDVNNAGYAIKQALTDGDPSFRLVRSEQPRSDLFAIQARQMMAFGYRDCFVVGSQVREGEVRILFKVLEYDHPPTLSLLGGVLTATVTQKEKSPGQQAQFQEQIREGAKLVEERIRQALGGK